MSITLELEFESMFPIKHKAEGLSEPSGLALAPDGTLWTVCDESRRLYRISTEGEPLSTLEINNRGLEGVTFDAEGRVCVVDEDASKIIVYNPQTGVQIAECKLKNLEGFCAIAEYFEDVENKGLEGITFDPLRSEILLLKQADPGLLIAITARLDRITAVDLLDERNGFAANKLTSEQCNYSGMCYDAARDLFWILNDKAECVHTYDRRRGTVIQSFALKNSQTSRAIRDAEGVAVDVESKRLYVVSDLDAELNVFRIVER